MDYLDDYSFVSMFPDEVGSIKVLIDKGCLRNRMACPGCNEEMLLVLNESNKVFRCKKMRCGHRELSVRQGSIFFKTTLHIREILRVSRCWINGETREMAVRSTKLSRDTITTWYGTFREMIKGCCSEVCMKIGGNGVIVEVDETLLGHRKYHKGHAVEGAWTMTGIERTVERRIFVVVVESRDAETIRKVISDHVHENSIVYTDGWKGYIGIDRVCNVRHLQ